jgi:hypothetical protein
MVYLYSHNYNMLVVGRDSVAKRYKNLLQTEQSGYRIAAGARFSAPVHAGPGVH